MFSTLELNSGAVNGKRPVSARYFPYRFLIAKNAYSWLAKGYGPAARSWGMLEPVGTPRRTR